MLPVSEKFLDYAHKVGETLRAKGVRVEVDESDEKLGYKIRQAQLQKVPYMLVVGAREQESESVALRVRTGEDRGALPPGEVAERILELTEDCSLEL